MGQKEIDNLYFKDGFTVHVNKAIDGFLFATAWGKEIRGGKYNKSQCKKGYGYGTPASLNLKVENGGRYNTHYWRSLKSMIEDIKRISKKDLINLSYYN